MQFFTLILYVMQSRIIYIVASIMACTVHVIEMTAVIM
jgi:hypothetical protein